MFPIEVLCVFLCRYRSVSQAAWTVPLVFMFFSNDGSLATFQKHSVKFTIVVEYVLVITTCLRHHGI